MLAASVGRHQVLAHAREPATETIGAAALGADARALEEQEQFVREHLRFAQAGRLREPDEPRPDCGLVLLDHATGRMGFFRKLDGGIGERTTALVAVGDMLGHLAKPRTQLGQFVAGMKLLQLVPAGIGGLRRLPQIFGDQFVLGLEVTVEVILLVPAASAMASTPTALIP